LVYFVIGFVIGLTSIVETTSRKVDLTSVREIGGYFRADHYGLLEVYGPDAQRFLQSQTTNNVAELGQLCSQFACILDRKAHIQAYFQLFRKHDSYRILVEKEQIAAILEHLEKYRFADKVEFLDLTHTGSFVAIQGPRARRVINSGFAGASRLEVFSQCLADVTLWHCPVHVMKSVLGGDEGFFLWVTKSDQEAFREKFLQACQESGLDEMTAEQVEVARVEAGLAKFGVDFSNENFLPETGLEQHSASYTKGCFLGQEVLARVKSQGAPTRGLMGVMFAKAERLHFVNNTKIHHRNEEMAWLRSNVFSERLGRTIAFAFVKRDFRVPDKTYAVQIDGNDYEMTIVSMPFYQAETASARAQRLYGRALQSFAHEQEATTNADTDHSVVLLREVLELDPFFEDGYEALGVILSKRGRLDEAITLMKKLAELNPDSVMAHTNLSVFYVEKGMKEAAEDEKAISMSIRMKLAAQLASAEIQDKKKKEEEEQEARDRMAMFKEVLDIDDDDLLANYGVGSCQVALGEYEQAIPFLEKALKIKPTHTVAYVCLGEAYEGLGKKSEAVDAYEQGIAVASKRGDMTPMQDMQKRLAVLQASDSNTPTK
jgi:folate-binding protein YgfZ